MYQQYLHSIVPPFRLAFLMWVFFTFQLYSGLDLGFLGILPRHASGLVGILFSPLVHGSVQHILSNTIPLIFLGTTLFVFYPRVALLVFFQSYLVSGMLVWIFGREFYHIGASGLIYGLAFFLISFGFFRKDSKSLLISIVVVALYGGMIYGVLPQNTNISWESHLYGALVGIGSAFYLRKSKSIPIRKRAGNSKS